MTPLHFGTAPPTAFRHWPNLAKRSATIARSGRRIERGGVTPAPEGGGGGPDPPRLSPAAIAPHPAGRGPATLLRPQGSASACQDSRESEAFMAKSGVRVAITLACNECKRRNY